MGLVHKRDMRKAGQTGQEQDGRPPRLSRTEKKKAALSLQDLGERLVTLSAQQLTQIELPADVLAAVMAAKTMTKHRPRSRQLQYIGSLMRKCDPAPIREYLDAVKQGIVVKPRS